MAKHPGIICGDPQNPDGPGKKHNGAPCNNRCAPGLTRCYMHGGRAPEALIKAKSQMALLRAPAIEGLHKVVEQLTALVDQFADDQCPTCGYPKGDADEKEYLVKACARLTRVCEAVLDRTDMGPKATLEVKQSDMDLDLRALTAPEENELDDILARYEALKANVNQRLHVVAYKTLPEDPPTIN